MNLNKVKVNVSNLDVKLYSCDFTIYVKTLYNIGEKVNLITRDVNFTIFREACGE